MSRPNSPFKPHLLRQSTGSYFRYDLVTSGRRHQYNRRGADLRPKVRSCDRARPCNPRRVHQRIAALADRALTIDLPRAVLSGRQAEMAPRVFDLAKRFRTSTAVLKASTVIGPAPGTIINRQPSKLRRWFGEFLVNCWTDAEGLQKTRTFLLCAYMQPVVVLKCPRYLTCARPTF